MTDSPDERGIDVALLYSPFSFALISYHSIRIAPPKGFRPTRDILYACGQLISGDTLHVFARFPDPIGRKWLSAYCSLLILSEHCHLRPALSLPETSMTTPPIPLSSISYDTALWKCRQTRRDVTGRRAPIAIMVSGAVSTIYFATQHLHGNSLTATSTTHPFCWSPTRNMVA